MRDKSVLEIRAVFDSSTQGNVSNGCRTFGLSCATEEKQRKVTIKALSIPITLSYLDVKSMGNIGKPAPQKAKETGEIYRSPSPRPIYFRAYLSFLPGRFRMCGERLLILCGKNPGSILGARKMTRHAFRPMVYSHFTWITVSHNVSSVNGRQGLRSLTFHASG